MSGSCCAPCEHGTGTCVAKSQAEGPRPQDFDGYVEMSDASVRWGVRKNFKVQRKDDLHGLDISIEHDKGMVREWKDDHTGESGKTKMHYPYGYICRTDGHDGEQVDVYVGPNRESKEVFIVHQMKKPDFTKFDEDKVMVGFNSAREAKSAYLMHFDNPKFFGSMTETDMDAFKRMFVNKSIEVEYEELRRSLLASTDDEMRKGVFDKLKEAWAKVREMFGRKESVDQGEDDDTDEEVAAKPTKTWHSTHEARCKTGVCFRLDGTEIDIDDQFEAMNGMMVDGPPAHLDCKCYLSFNMNKALAPMPELASEPPAMMPPPMQPAMQMPAAMPMMQMPPPNDVETFEGVMALLGRMGSVKDPELMEIASKIWGDGYTFEGQLPDQARGEIIGFLMDQRDLLGVEQEMPSSQPSQSLPVQAPNSSSTSSQVFGDSPQTVPPQEANSSGTESPDGSLMDWFEQDYWKKVGRQQGAGSTN